jgi:hypothetical protein
VVDGARGFMSGLARHMPPKARSARNSRWGSGRIGFRGLTPSRYACL